MSRSAFRFRNISLTEFANTFVPFALLLVAALLAPERTDDPNLYRVKFTIWLSTALLIPGLCLYVLPSRFERQANYSLLFVTFSYLAYMVHFYFATFTIFGGVAGIFTNMRFWIATVNVIVTVWWTIDTVLAWFGPQHASWLSKGRCLFYTFLFLVFVVTDLFLRPGVIRYLGILLLLSVAVCYIIRLYTYGFAPASKHPDRRDAPEVGETRGVARARLAFTFVVFIVAMIAAHVGAEAQSALDAAARVNHVGVEGTHSTLYYRVIFTIWVTALLLTAALCAYALTRPGKQNSYWKGFWTVAFVALLVHLFWTIWATFHGDFHEILHSRIGEANDPERIVQHPIPDLILAAWWGLDVVLAWLIARPSRWVCLQRGAVHALAFVMFFGAFVLAEKATISAHLIGITMGLLVGLASTVRLIRYETDPTSFLLMVYIRMFQALNSIVPWHKLPTMFAVANLGALRDVLRANNLHDTSKISISNPAGLRAYPKMESRFISERETDGFFNDLKNPAMGSSGLNMLNVTSSSDFTVASPGARFGRNIPLTEVGPLPTESVVEPNPRSISSQLLARPAGQFTPATTLNLLAAAWIQFQTHDWFNHGTPVCGNEFKVPIPPGDQWHQDPMLVRRTRPDPTRQDPTIPYPETGPTDGQVPTFANAETHWWDGSEIYGSSLQAAARLRTYNGDGKIRVMGDGKDQPGQTAPKRSEIENTGLTVNWWLGLSLLHDLFAKEHNAICDALKLEYSDWNDDQLYRVARLANTALMAKIHTVDWTPAILGHPALQIGMRANWWGLLTERVKKSLGRVSESEAFSGIAGSRTEQHGADYSLTEEFTSVYRMHSLMPETVDLLNSQDGELIKRMIFGSDQDNDPRDAVGPYARQHAFATNDKGQQATMQDIMYSFGIASPGALVLRNFPRWMLQLRRRQQGVYEETIDLAAIDVIRDRERGVPRYNRFRRLFHLPEFASIDELICHSQQLSEDASLAQAFKRIYNDDIEQVDLLVGMHAETPPEGFGFSDTAFRVFILMASRRIKSDRFLSSDYRPEVYSQVGYDWVENNNMASVLMRHYPQLTSAIQNVANPFAPWNENAL